MVILILKIIIIYINLLNIISKPSNILNKITIVEGWSKKQLNLELSKYFKILIIFLMKI